MIEKRPEDGVEERRYVGASIVDLVPLLFGQGQISLGPLGSMVYTHVWHYERMVDACRAFLAWDGDHGEPDGWTRALTPETAARGVYRRRPNGLAALEYEAE